MLTKVYLDGALGKKFGNEWLLDVASPSEALRLIDANVGGLLSWIRFNLKTYSRYCVIVRYEDGSGEELKESDYIEFNRSAVEIRFVPVIEGSGKWTNTIIGAILIVVGAYYGGPVGTAMMKQGAVMMLGGVITALTSRISNSRLSSGTEDGKVIVSDVFDGPVNTVEQGSPIPLIYGRCLTGSQVVSATVGVV